MTAPERTRDSALFLTLVAQLMQMAMIALGKIINPATGKTAVDLTQARDFIDMLLALQTRTQGNLSDEERQMLERAVNELRMMFVDEERKAAG